MKWEKVKIASLCDRVISGGTPKSDETSYYADGTIPWLRTQEVQFNRIYDTEIKITENGLNNSNAKWIKENSVIVAMYGNSAGRTAINKIPLTTNQACCNLEINSLKADYNFVYYKLLAEFEALKGLSKGAAQNNLNANDVKEFPVTIPPLPTQRKIASILSAYDDLIENNLKRIKLLEEKAFLRYKQIVREEKMEVEDKLENLIQTVKRKAKIPKADYIEKGDFPIIDQSTDFIGGYTNEKEAVYEHLPMIVFGDHTRILKYINFPFACGADGTQLVKPENPSISVAYLYFELISCNLSNYHYARHFKFLKEQVIKLPSEKVMLEYKEETDKVFNLIQLLRLQNTKLREARDILLPKLMNGQIEV